MLRADKLWSQAQGAREIKKAECLSRALARESLSLCTVYMIQRVININIYGSEQLVFDIVCIKRQFVSFAPCAALRVE
jgi:hypothetical protein